MASLSDRPPPDIVTAQVIMAAAGGGADIAGDKQCGFHQYSKSWFDHYCLQHQNTNMLRRAS